MIRLLCASFVLVSMLLGAHPATAIQLTRPQVEYSADSTMETEGGTIQERIYITPTKERRETQGLGGDSTAGETPVQIIRKDAKVIWQLMPSEKMYMEQPFGQSSAKQDTSNWDFQDTVVGEEVLDGIKVTKYKTIATSTDGKKYGGFSWRTKEGVSIKTDLLFKEGDEKHRMATELKNLKIGKQDPQLFEIPKGFTKFDMAGMMGGMGGMMGGMTGEKMDRPGMGKPRMGTPDIAAPSDEKPANPELPADEASEMKKATDMMKKLFGR